MSKVLSVSDAVSQIADGAVVSVSSSSTLGCPDAVLAPLGARFVGEGHPKNFTSIHRIAGGDVYGVKGMIISPKMACCRACWPGPTPQDRLASRCRKSGR